MKKSMSIILAVCMAAAWTMGGCGSGSAPQATPSESGSEAAQTPAASAEEPEQGDSGKKRELVFYSVTPNEADAVHLMEDFEKEHNVKVTGVYTTAEEFMKIANVAINGGQQIDVFGINGQDMRTLAGRGVIKELDKIDYWDRFTPASVAQYTIGDKHFGVPMSDASGMLIYYNKDLFDQYSVKVPTNMDELKTARDEFAKHDISVFAHCGGTIYMWPSWYFTLFNSASNGRAIERTTEILTGKGKFTDEDSLLAMQILETLGDGYFQPGVNGADRDGGEQVFIKGQAAMTFAGTWQLDNFRKGGMEGDTLQAYNDLHFVEGQPFSSTGSASGECATIYSKISAENEELAYQFIDYMTSDAKVVERYYADYLEKPGEAARSLANVNAKLPENVVADPCFTVFSEEMVPNMQLWLDWLWPAEVVTTAQEQIQAVVGQQTTAQAAVEAMQATLDDLLASGYDFNAAQ